MHTTRWWLGLACVLSAGCTSVLGNDYSFDLVDGAAGGGGASTTCGNGVIESGEECDGSNVAGLNCTVAVGRPATGALVCTSSCQLERSGCHYCGDGRKDAGETCDGSDIGGVSCQSEVSADSTGTVACTAQCVLDLQGCSKPLTCGNGMLDEGEKCDGELLGGATCASALGKPDAVGPLGCAANCTFDISACGFCGDEAIQGKESCDGTAFGSVTCALVLGVVGSDIDAGPLACTTTCTLDASQCHYCGDGKTEKGEQCDATDLGGATCASVLGKADATGTVGCAKDCLFDTSNCQYCGDGKINAAEECESGDLNGATCDSVVGPGSAGKLGCFNCAFDIHECTASVTCNNQVLDPGEECDSTLLNGATCQSVLGEASAAGTVTCSSLCKLDTSGCEYCGDGKVNGTEVCDGIEVGGGTCVTATMNPAATGTLKCKGDCSGVDTSGCQYCGDGKINGAETCDQDNLGDATCASFLGKSDATGTLGCSSTCQFDPSQCAYCGDGVINNKETCEEGDFGGATCASLLGAGSVGNLVCAGCTIDTAGCSVPPKCGNGTVDAGEQCDGADLGGATCQTATGQASASGTPSCTSNCALDVASCVYCGNNKVETGEQCDGSTPASAACPTGFVGAPQCSSACLLDPSTCTCPAPNQVCPTGNQSTCVDLSGDGTNCGFCGHSCLGGACTGGACAVTSINVKSCNPLMFELDAQGKFFVAGFLTSNNQLQGCVVAQDVSGPGSVILAQGQNLLTPRFLTSDADNLYLASSIPGQAKAQVWKISKTPQSATPLGTVNNQYAAGICQSGGTLFLTTSTTSEKNAWLVPTTQGSLTNLLVSTQSGEWSSLTACTKNEMILGRNELDGRPLQQIKTSKQTSNLVVNQMMNTRQVVLVNGNLYWTISSSSGGSVLTAKADGSGVKTLLTSGSIAPRGLVVDDQGIYWADITSNTINYLSLDGTVQHTIANASGQPYNLRLDAQYVYYLAQNKNFIYRAPR